MDINVAIIGAGPSGLTLASLLHRHHVSFTVFDLESRPSDPNEPSELINIQPDGLRAIEACGLLAPFQQLSDPTNANMIIADKNGRTCLANSLHHAARPVISWTALMALFRDSIPASSIRWRHKLTSLERVAGGRWALGFEEQPRQLFDLVVGADGEWSQVRATVTTVRPEYAGVQCLAMNIHNISSRYPDLLSVVGPGSFIALGEGKAIFSQRGSQDSARLYLMLRSPSERYLAETGLDGMSAHQTQRKLLDDADLFGTWGPQLKQLVWAGCEERKRHRGVSGPLYMLPVAHEWEHVEGVTLMGDAAHLMSPFSCEGTTSSAMHDALELGTAITSLSSSSSSSSSAAPPGPALSTALRAYEQAMWQRAHAHASQTHHNLQAIFADDAPTGFVRAVAGEREREGGRIQQQQQQEQEQEQKNVPLLQSLYLAAAY